MITTDGQLLHYLAESLNNCCGAGPARVHKAAVWACAQINKLETKLKAPAQTATDGVVQVRVPMVGAKCFVRLGVGLHAGTVEGWALTAQDGALNGTVTVDVRWLDEGGDEAVSTVPPEDVFDTAQAAALAMWGRA